MNFTGKLPHFGSGRTTIVKWNNKGAQCTFTWTRGFESLAWPSKTDKTVTDGQIKPESVRISPGGLSKYDPAILF
ncbi:hypothetical protein FRC19_003563 [Serendipita sp. 401]|nr:hypothetical protein FRC18_004287 [Serendipita sp. 400]KAG8811849.1 hypothetical protein FRC19_003563 [Serendipita sp. 401]KAG9025651.1 hypothetical protein FS842_005205 [Serendipita sp. 407]